MSWSPTTNLHLQRCLLMSLLEEKSAIERIFRESQALTHTSPFNLTHSLTEADRPARNAKAREVVKRFRILSQIATVENAETR